MQYRNKVGHRCNKEIRLAPAQYGVRLKDRRKAYAPQVNSAEIENLLVYFLLGSNRK